MTDILYKHVDGGGPHAFPSTAFTADGNVTAIDRGAGDQFIVTNPHPGITQGYSIDLLGFNFDFTGNVPTSGTITEVLIKDAQGNVYVDMTNGEGSFSNPNLVQFWNTLQSNGPKAALDGLVGDYAVVTGSNDGDQVETYGKHGDYSLGTGNDLLDIFHKFTYAVGGAGNDTFQIEQSALQGLDLHGGLSNGTVAPGEVNTIDFHVGGKLAFAAIDGFNSFQFSAPGVGTPFDQFIFLSTDQLPGGTTPVFQVTGSAANHGNEIVIEPSPSGGPEHIDLSHVTVSNFMRLNQAFWFDFGGVTSNETAIGAPNARNVFHFGSGNDHAIGGNLADIFIAGRGHDYFNGGGGIDVAQYHAGIGQYTVTKLDAHTYRVHDNRPGSPDGTDTLVNVEYLKFTNATVYIGGPVAVVHTMSALHTHDIAPMTVHHFDLFA